MSVPILPYHLKFQQRDGYLYACVTAASIDRQTALSYLNRIAARVVGSAYTKLMLERDIPAVLPSSDLFFTTQDFLEMVGSTVVAFVNKHAPIHAELEFAMMIGTNRGANYRLFRDAADAEEWLISQ